MDIVKLDDGTVNRFCVSIWNYLKTNPTASNSEIKLEFESGNEKFLNTLWIMEDKSTITSIEYCLKKLYKLGCLAIEDQERDSDGRYSYSIKSFLKEPQIAIKQISCTKCNKVFDKKLPKAKIQDLCLDCTKEIYMTSKAILCELCNKSVPYNLSHSMKGKLYHKECKAKVFAEIKAQKTLERESKRIKLCGDCGNLIEGRINRKYCDNCSDVRNNKSLCYYCKGPGVVAGSIYCDDCRVEHYITNDKWAKVDICKKIIGEECCVCGYKNFLNYHHVIHKENGGKDLLSNIVPLCPNHHSEVHYLNLDVSKQHKVVLKRIEDIKNGLIVFD